MSANNYINEALKNPRYSIIYKGKEVKKYAFLKQAKQFCMKHNNVQLFYCSQCEILDNATGEIIK